MFVSEIMRLVKLFDEQGKIIDAKLYTITVAREKA